MSTYRLSANAQASLREIQSYSSKQFGEAQTRLYLTRLRERMQWLAENPQAGRKREEIKPGYHSYFEGSHTIYYLIREDHIAVIDVLHQAMEVERYLGGA
jgi:toxin ParE1/3/4